MRCLEDLESSRGEGAEKWQGDSCGAEGERSGDLGWTWDVGEERTCPMLSAWATASHLEPNKKEG